MVNARFVAPDQPAEDQAIGGIRAGKAAERTDYLRIMNGGAESAGPGEPAGRAAVAGNLDRGIGCSLGRVGLRDGAKIVADQPTGTGPSPVDGRGRARIADRALVLADQSA